MFVQELRRESENEALDARLSLKFDILQNDMELMRYSTLLSIIYGLYRSSSKLGIFSIFLLKLYGDLMSFF